VPCPRYEADSGKGLCKERIATSGQGKRGALRTLIAKESSTAIFYLAGRQKIDPGTDFSDASIAQAQLIGQALLAANAVRIHID
jgi:hypothetical protein